MSGYSGGYAPPPEKRLTLQPVSWLPLARKSGTLPDRNRQGTTGAEGGKAVAGKVGDGWD